MEISRKTALQLLKRQEWTPRLVRPARPERPSALRSLRERPRPPAKR